MAGRINANPNTRTVNFDWNEPIRTLRLHVDQDKVRLLGLSSQDLAQSLQAAFSGTTVTQLRDFIYLVDVQVRAAGSERADLDTVRMLQIPLGGGRNVPLMEVASVDYGFEPPIIWRRQRLPTLTVQADLAPGIQAATVVEQLSPSVQKLANGLPQGYRIAVGGAVEEAAKGQRSVAVVVPVMLLLMLTVLMVQLQSFQRLLLVISVAPLGLIGIVGALLPTHTPMGFIAILGCVALAGMIIRNSVILIDQIETNIAAGIDRWEALVEATCHRLRPIMLTAAAAILGMIPIASDSFWRPMAMAIMGGLAVATVLTLLFLPAAYAAWFRIREPAVASAEAGKRKSGRGSNMASTSRDEIERKLLEQNIRIGQVLGTAIAMRDHGAGAHNQRVALYSGALGEVVDLDMPTLRALIAGAFLHDIGKIAIPDRVLLKACQDSRCA